MRIPNQIWTTLNSRLTFGFSWVPNKSYLDLNRPWSYNQVYQDLKYFIGIFGAHNAIKSLMNIWKISTVRLLCQSSVRPQPTWCGAEESRAAITTSIQYRLLVLIKSWKFHRTQSGEKQYLANTSVAKSEWADAPQNQCQCTIHGKHIGKGWVWTARTECE